jgi:5'/3'-nucleotidase SurE
MPRHSRLPGAGAALLAATALLAAAAPAQAEERRGTQPLRVLVTNDDGWRGAGGAETPLIVALRDALAGAGHDVTVVAPDSDQSGTGTRLTFGRPLTLANPGAGVWTVSGSPGDSVFLGTDVLFRAERPDLVVSGINPGGNYSSLLNHSGTVGAAVAALELDVPGIAVSIDGDATQIAAATDEVADYTVRLVAALGRRARGGDLLPDGVGLNVNYPARQEPTGARLTRQDPNSYIAFSYRNTTGALGEPGVYTQAFGAPTVAPMPGSDWAAVSSGAVSIQPITADRTAQRRGGLRFLTRIDP